MDCKRHGNFEGSECPLCEMLKHEFGGNRKDMTAPNLPAEPTPMDDVIDRVFNRSSRCTITDGAGNVYSGIKVKIVDLDALRAQLVAANAEVERLKGDIRLQIINRQELQARINDRDQTICDMNARAEAMEKAIKRARALCMDDKGNMNVLDEAIDAMVKS